MHPGLASELDSLVASSQRTLVVNLTAELERRTAAVQEASGVLQVVWEALMHTLSQLLSRSHAPAKTVPLLIRWLCQHHC